MSYPIHSYNLRSQYSYKGQKHKDYEYIRLINKLGFNEIMSKYNISEIIKNNFLKSQGFDTNYIYQGFAFEGIYGELAEINSNYGIAIETLGLINYIPILNKVKKMKGHIGYTEDGIPVSLREMFKWLDVYQQKKNN